MTEGRVEERMDSIPLEPGSADRTILTTAVMSFVDAFLDDRQHGPAVSEPATAALLDQLLGAPPEDGTDIGSLIELVAAAVDTGFDTASGRHLSYIPSGGLYSAALGGLLGAVANRYTAGAHAAPGMVAVEESVIQWMASLFALGPRAGGLLLSGGSMANLTAIVTARSRLGDRFDHGVIYTSRRTHHSLTKGARIAGIAPDRVRLVATDDRLRLDPEALAAAIESDSDAGLCPLMVSATAGTTDTGAVDPLEACAEIAAHHQAWFHVDAAYGGFFQLTDRGRRLLAGIERADSITVDAHKSLFLPFGIGGLLVRDVEHLVDAHEGEGAYMQDVIDSRLPHYMAMGPEQSRPNRGLPVWLALHVHGVAAFRQTLDSMLDLAVAAADHLVAIPGIELITRPQLSIVAFRSVDGDDATAHMLRRLNESSEVHVSSTTIDDKLWVRLALLSQRTTASIVDRVIELISDPAL